MYQIGVFISRLCRTFFSTAGAASPRIPCYFFGPILKCLRSAREQLGHSQVQLGFVRSAGSEDSF